MYVPTYLPIYLPTYLPTYLPIYLPIYLSIHPSIDPSIYLSTYLLVSIYLYTCRIPLSRQQVEARWVRTGTSSAGPIYLLFSFHPFVKSLSRLMITTFYQPAAIYSDCPAATAKMTTNHIQPLQYTIALGAPTTTATAA